MGRAPRLFASTRKHQQREGGRIRGGGGGGSEIGRPSGPGSRYRSHRPLSCALPGLARSPHGGGARPGSPAAGVPAQRGGLDGAGRELRRRLGAETWRGSRRAAGAMTGVGAEQEFDFDFLFEFKHSDEGGGGGGSRRGVPGTSGSAGGGMLRGALPCLACSGGGSLSFPRRDAAGGGGARETGARPREAPVASATPGSGERGRGGWE